MSTRPLPSSAPAGRLVPSWAHVGRLLVVLCLSWATACSSTSSVSDDGGRGDARGDAVRQDGLWDVGGSDTVPRDLSPLGDGKPAGDALPWDDVAPGEFGAPCLGNIDCASGWCVGWDEGYVCTVLCIQECPAGWDCRQVLNSQPDLIFACHPAESHLCRRCASDYECGSGLCVDVGGERHCTRACGEHESCPAGYSCGSVESEETGATSTQCLPTSGSCDCGPVDAGRQRSCSHGNEHGLCWGAETCDQVLGWTGCTAAEPGPELCDALDNDCDGVADEAPEPPNQPCRHDVSGVGVCEGIWACRGAAGWECTARFPTLETCDYRDEDCDGETDEDFRDPSTGAYGHLEHCGACNHSCVGALAHGTERCDASGEPPLCVIDTCDPGYYLANPFTCLPPSDELCAPCASDGDCHVPGDVCVQQAEGGFCGRDCAPGSIYGESCPDGYGCRDVVRGGDTLRQCLPLSGTCLCTLDEDGAVRTCQRSNAAGTCFGQQVCDGTTGWSDCDAAEPAIDVCNGQDDDCDGYADEDASPPAEPCERTVVGLGTCAGVWVCGGQAGWECTAEEPVPEVCNYRDDDCDGTVDEGFTADGTDRYVAFHHCGACDLSCDGALPHAIERCAGERPTPICVVDRCDVGYYRVSETSCAPVRDTSCTPCADDSGCPVPGDRCLDIDGLRFCARSCAADNPFGDPAGMCGAAFTCAADGDGDGAHCLPSTGSCTCYRQAHDGSQRSCIRLGDAGLCTGLASCAWETGWTECSAREPAGEVCNGVDDDCDGFLDEDVQPPAEPCRTTWTDPETGAVAACDGAWVCAIRLDGADWECRAPQAGPETCDGRDNDCDGATDEDFRDGGGVYDDFDHCGRCNFSCGEVGQGAILYAAETACDATSGVARCVVVSCEPGFYLPAGQAQVCLPEGDVSDCSPCGEDVHCEALPGRCVDLDGGRFCAGACEADGECPTGFGCEDGGCVPRSGSCTCLEGHEGNRRSCARESEIGHCSGFQVCDPALGWSACDARTPQPDTCNGVDDDCDGLVDEDLVPPEPECTRTSEWGTCVGSWFCGDEGGTTTWRCDASTPLAEHCNHIDDDCDGTTDEDFRNAAGLYDDYANCGLCGYSCEGAIPFAAVTACDASGGAPRCVVERCEPGYYQVSALTCLPAADSSCTPCENDGDCPVPGDRCAFVDGGGFCARDCGPGNPFGDPVGTCGVGFACTPDGVGAGQHCLPASGSCTCRLAEHAGQSRLCRNDVPGVGTCFGRELCAPAVGWSVCDAATPLPETCNGLDDDCDGRADEGLARLGTACDVTNGEGTCFGVWVCAGDEGWECTAPTPARDDCNYVDDDCDGAVDQAFVDPASGAYVHDEHCGACGVSCVGVIPNATARCALFGGHPRCEVAACDEGHYQAGPLTCLASVDTSCTPCATDANCPVPGDRCLEIDGARFCGRDCAAGNLHGAPPGVCAPGFECLPLTVDGDAVEQCVPASGSCTCLAEHDGDARTCVRTNGEGTCYGTETCDPDAGWSACTARVPAAETCNGTDDNCNGATDDVLGLGTACEVGAPGFDSTCDGALVCRAGSAAPQCSAPAPAEETCNYADDDCDGATDEAFPELYASCSDGVGACLRYGFHDCRPDGAGTRCTAQAAPEGVEVCNGVDDDCDGAADEGPLWVDQGDVCTVGAGVCARTGVFVCDAADRAGPLVCSAVQAPEQPEVCNGVDDDCDGETDEDPQWAAKGGVCTVGVGICARTGVFVCDTANRAGPLVCNVQEGAPQMEICNGVDDDCDGATDLDDADLVPLPCALQAGVCRGAEELCRGAAGWQTCAAPLYAAHSAQYQATEVTCDGLDNDCDGATDDALPQVPCAEQRGVCAGSAKACGGAAGWLDCAAERYGPSYQAAEATCDGLDNDCDGAIDEGLTGALCAVQGGVCAGSREACGGTAGWRPCGPSLYTGHSAFFEATEVTCDGRDNDCDGTTDESLPQAPCAEQRGVCAGSVKACGGAAGWLDCAAARYGPSYQATEATCDGLDNDCDGSIDEGLTGALCAVQGGVCAGSREACGGTAGWRPCGPSLFTAHSGSYEATEVTCDGRDNDCDGATDEELPGVPCAERRGVCAGSTKTCGGAAGWLDCTAADYGLAFEATEASCDGLDNDCDGGIDEGLAGDLCPVQAGVCEGAREACQGAGGWYPCDQATYTGHSSYFEATEVSCDGLDNDCDGAVDEDLPRLPCALQNGVCAGALRTCGGPTGWRECAATNYGGAYEAVEATCDGLDNDCDGSIDEALVGAACPVQAGVCAGARQVCRGTAGWQTCTAPLYAAYSGSYEATEVTCDGRDNDCDGATDDDLPQAPCVEQRGVCAGSVKACGGAAGWQACTAARYGAAYEAVEATCDGLDNDCDGSIDESLTGAVCPTQAGVCAGSRQVCRGTLGWQACAGPTYAAYSGFYEATEVTCDGRDNDCDGVTDDDLPTPPCVEQRGVCAGSSKACGGAAGWLTCTAARFGAAYEALEATCDGLDNDCDGSIDESLTGAACPLQGGVCAGSRQVCRGTSGWQVCTAPLYAAYSDAFEATEVTCDGLDNDCDGATDDDLPTTPCAEQRGVCAGAVKACGGVVGWLACTAPRYGASYEAAEATCDGLDNDCDGSIDESLAGALCAVQAGVCAGSREVCRGTSGWQACGAPLFAAYSGSFEATEVTCDGADNDCDGATDDDLPTPPCAEQRGVCAGSVKACGGAAGWLACTAARYGANYQGVEATCDGLDNDCDGATDESWPTKGSVCAVGDGICRRNGVFVCDSGDPGGAVVCDAQPGAGSPFELCDYQDDDCDGATDEPFREIGTGRYVDLQNCGSCGNDCTQNFPSAVGIAPFCDVATATPSCSFTCLTGQVDADGVPENGCELTIDPYAIYVATAANGGDDVAGCGVWQDGALAVPCETIAYALGRAASLPVPPAGERRKALVSDGAYEESVTLVDGFDVLGGYSHRSWSRDWGVNVTTILGAPNGSGDLTTVLAQGIAVGATLEGFNVYGRIAETPGANSYAVRVVDCGSALVVRNNRIFGGYGAAGLRGGDGGEGTAGVVGSPGLAARNTPSDACSGQTTAGGAAGALTCTGGVVASGGAGATVVCPGDWLQIPYWDFQGQQQPGGASAAGGAAGGAGGYDGGINPDYACSTCFVGSNPRNGADATSGSHGTSGDGGGGATSGEGGVAGGDWRGEGGLPGALGAAGRGGGGGGGGGGVDINEDTGSCATRGGDALGGSGGGGGSGACGGSGGGSGGAGGAAFAVFVVFTTPPATLPVLVDNVIRLGYGGAGGRGGAGGTGGIGGDGGVGGPDNQTNLTTWCAAHGGRGGRGGDGGHGGGGGGGSGGAAVGVYVAGEGTQTPAWDIENTFLTGGRAGDGGAGGEGLAGAPATTGGDGAAGLFGATNL